MSEQIDDLFNKAAAVKADLQATLERYFFVQRNRIAEGKKPVYDTEQLALQEMGQLSLGPQPRNPVDAARLVATETGLRGLINKLEDDYAVARGNFRAEVINEMRKELFAAADTYARRSEGLIEIWEEVAGLNNWLKNNGGDPRLPTDFITSVKLPSIKLGAAALLDGTQARMFRANTSDILTPDGQALFDGTYDCPEPEPEPAEDENLNNRPGALNAALGV